MIAVLGGLGAAIAWACATLAASRASRSIGAWSTLAGVSIVGFVLCVPLVATTRLPGPADTEQLWWVGVCGVSYVVGLLANYGALARGKVGIVAPIASTEGAIAAVIAIVLGERAGLLLVMSLAVVATGLVLATLEPRGRIADVAAGSRMAIALAATAALLFGVNLYVAGSLSASVPASWIVASGRVVGMLMIVLPLVVSRRLHLTRAALPWMLIAGSAEVIGYFSILWGSGESIAVTAVLASQFAVLATIGAFVLGERLARHQWIGIVTATGGVAVVTLVRVLHL